MNEYELGKDIAEIKLRLAPWKNLSPPGNTKRSRFSQAIRLLSAISRMTWLRLVCAKAPMSVGLLAGRFQLAPGPL